MVFVGLLGQDWMIQKQHILCNVGFSLQSYQNRASYSRCQTAFFEHLLHLEPHVFHVKSNATQRSREHCSCLLHSAGLRPGLKFGWVGQAGCEVTDSSRLESGLPFIQAELFQVRLAIDMTHNIIIRSSFSQAYDSPRCESWMRLQRCSFV